MSTILGQVSYPVFLYCVFTFFTLASIFAFIVGISLALRSETMLRLFAFMNESYSVRRAMKPLDMPHFVEPILLKHPDLLGIGILLGAAASIYLLMDIPAESFEPVFSGIFSYFSARVVADYTRLFLLIGNGVCVVVGLLLLFLPKCLSSLEVYTDRWYSLRKHTRPLNLMHFGIDNWVLTHPTIFGVTLSMMSLGMGVSMYARI